MNIRVGLMEGRPRVPVVLQGSFRDAQGLTAGPGSHEFTSPVCLRPENPVECRFVVPDVTIGIGFHWERQFEQTFKGSLRIEPDPEGLTLINEVPIEDYVESVITSEMSGDSPLEFLKAHAVISRSWVAAQIARSDGGGTVRREQVLENGEREIICWYGTESHSLYDVCGDDHCQRYQGAARSESGTVRLAVQATSSEFLISDDEICDARFSKCCGGVTESFSAAWENRDVSYLRPVRDGEGPMPLADDAWIRSRPEAWCNTSDTTLLGTILPGFDQETTDFFRWQETSTPEELGTLVHHRTGIDPGPIVGLDAVERGPSGRIVKLRIRGNNLSFVIGKELKIRRALSTSHLYSSAFVADVRPDRIVLDGAGWGHGVGLCQIGAGVQAFVGRGYREILTHYYPGAEVAFRQSERVD